MHLGVWKYAATLLCFCFFRVVSQMSECCGWEAKLPCALHPYCLSGALVPCRHFFPTPQADISQSQPLVVDKHPFAVVPDSK